MGDTCVWTYLAHSVQQISPHRKILVTTLFEVEMNGCLGKAGSLSHRGWQCNVCSHVSWALVGLDCLLCPLCNQTLCCQGVALPQGAKG